MTDQRFPITPEDVIATLRELCRLQSESALVALLGDASGEITETGYDNWGGGTYFYTLHLAVPLPDFARVEAQVEDLEASLGRKARFVSKNLANSALTAVSIAPRVLRTGPVAGGPAQSTADLNRIWEPDRVRLFLSHVAEHKVLVASLKRELEARGASAFVAHEDIEPSLEWQREIINALGSMDVMVALVTDDFHQSLWTDHEVGIALGRGVPVLPVSLPTSPYGFMAKWQGLPGDLSNAVALAESIIRVLLGRDGTKEQVKRGLVNALETSKSFLATKVVVALLESDPILTPGQVEQVRFALVSNDQVAKAFRVPERIARILRVNGVDL